MTPLKDIDTKDLLEALERTPESTTKQENIHSDVLKFIRNYNIGTKKGSFVWCYIAYELFLIYTTKRYKNNGKTYKVPMTDRKFFIELGKVFGKKNDGTAIYYNINIPNIYKFDIDGIIEKWEVIIKERKFNGKKRETIK